MAYGPNSQQKITKVKPKSAAERFVAKATIGVNRMRKLMRPPKRHGMGYTKKPSSKRLPRSTMLHRLGIFHSASK
jgi:hypothetical protein